MKYPRIAAAVILAALAPFDLTGQTVVHPRGSYVTVSGHRIWYESEGQGKEILLLHPGGPGASHDYFHPWFSALRDRARVIYIDPFGTGKSDRAKRPTEYSLAGEVDDIEAIRKALHLGRINLLGHSYGGVVALSYAVKYPQSLKRLIISNTLVSSAAWQITNNHANAETKLFFPERGNPDPGQVMAHFFFYDRSNFAKLNQANNLFNAQVMTAIGGDDMDNTLGGELAHFDFHGKFQSPPFAMLILAGRGDGVVMPQLARDLAAAAPRARFIMFDHSGHYPFIEQPDLVMRAIGDFLASPVP
jgi:proline iminopeptidase